MSFLSLPLLFLLHGLYLIYSSLPRYPFKRAAQASAPSSQVRRAPPRHVAVLLVSAETQSPRQAASDGVATEGEEVAGMHEAMLESIELAVSWADEEGVEEVTIFEGGHNPHLLERLHSPLLSLLTHTPPSPPHSTPSSPPSPSSSWPMLPGSNPDRSLEGRARPKDVGPTSEKGGFRNGKASLSVWSPSASADDPDSKSTRLRQRGTASTISPRPSSRPHRPITLNLLLPSTSYTLLSDITSSLASSKTNPDEITVNLVQSLVDEALSFQTTTEPELLLIHHVSPSHSHSPTLLSALVRRITSRSNEPEPVELHDFPPWLLRLTEIYQPPAPRPPFLSRKSDKSRHVARVLERETWEGGMCAWEGVEQRFGR